jgi:hypothetical protein
LSARTFACFILHETMPTSYVSAVVEVRRQGNLLGYVVFWREFRELVCIGDAPFYDGYSNRICFRVPEIEAS